MILYLISQIFINCSELLYEVCAIFIVYYFMTCAIMSDIRIMNKLIIYANIKFWDALCLFLAFCLSTRRVGVLGRLEQSLYVQAWCLDNMNSPRYFRFLPVMGGRHQVVTDLVVLPILPVRLWSRSFMDIWAMELVWIFSTIYWAKTLI